MKTKKTEVTDPYNTKIEPYGTKEMKRTRLSAEIRGQIELENVVLLASKSWFLIKEQIENGTRTLTPTLAMTILSTEDCGEYIP